MRTTNDIVIRAPLDRVFEAAAQVELWPERLAHYRRVSILSGGGDRRSVEMFAHRDGIPCRWTADQVLDAGKGTVYYRHTRSRFTQGMDVWWILTPKGGSETAILLTHDMPPERGFKGWFRQRVVGDLFVHNIAGKTLAGLKRHLEA